MRKLFILAAFSLISAFAVTGCSDDDDQNRLVLGTNALTFSYDEVGQPQTVTVDTDAADFKAQYNSGIDWLEIKQSASSFTVTVTKVNEGEAKREATITVTAGDANAQEVKVTQESASSGTYDYTITITGETNIEFAWDDMNSDKVFSARTDSPDGFNEPKVEYVDPQDKDWLDVAFDAQDATKVRVATTSKNMGTEERKATIVISAKGAASKSVSVVQSAPEPDYSIAFENGEDTEEMSFEYDTDLTQTIEVITIGTGLTATPDKSWITEAKFDGNILTVTVEENDTRDIRDGIVEITNEQGEKASLNVIQLGIPTLDLLGEWNWSSVSADTYGELPTGKSKSGTVTITRTSDDLYAVSGIIGSVFEKEKYEGIAPLMFLEVVETEDGDIVKVARRWHPVEDQDPDNPAFSYDGVQYYFSHVIKLDGMTASASNEGQIICDYVKSEGTETITFPKSIKITADDFPIYAQYFPHLLGTEAGLAYAYYYTEVSRGQLVPRTEELHTDVVLTRTK